MPTTEEQHRLGVTTDPMRLRQQRLLERKGEGPSKLKSENHIGSGSQDLRSTKGLTTWDFERVYNSVPREAQL